MSTDSSHWPDTDDIIDKSSIERVVATTYAEVAEFLEHEKLDSTFLKGLSQTYIPLAAWIASKHHKQPLLIGINGAQGSGKSTLSALLKILLSSGFGKSTTCFSIDDLYLSQRDRKALSEKVHPLLKVRGVPGTHDIDCGLDIIASLTKPNLTHPVTIPQFDKAQDDLLPRSQWRTIDKPVDIVIFEGWCVGARAQSPETLADAVNDLEAKEDPNGTWRQYVNQQLEGPYQRLFKQIDYLLMLKVPDMASVFEWRELQEAKLRERYKQNAGMASNIMTPEQISRFIMFYERITRRCLDEMPERANLVFELNKHHQIENVRLNE